MQKGSSISLDTRFPRVFIQKKSQFGAGFLCLVPHCPWIFSVLDFFWEIRVWRGQSRLDIFAWWLLALQEFLRLGSHVLMSSVGILRMDSHKDGIYCMVLRAHPVQRDELLPWKLTWHWEITNFNRRYIYKWLFLSIVMLVFRGVDSKEVSNRTVPEQTPKKTWVSNSSIVTYWKVSVGEVQFNSWWT